MLVSAVASATILSCAQPADQDPTSTELIEFEPGMFTSLTRDGKADLPNATVTARGLDTSGYKAIATRWASGSFDVTRSNAPAAFAWPVASTRSVLNRAGTPIRLSSEVYEHTGLDIIRNSEADSDVVTSPVTGRAMLTDWFGGDLIADDQAYSTVLSIWDPTTHLVIQVMHLNPDPALPRTGFFDVQRGQVIGKLAEIQIAGGRHVHVNVVDAKQMVLIDPVTVFPDYVDSIAPKVKTAYLLDPAGKRFTKLISGPLDIVAATFDRDNNSPRNLEPASIAYIAKDQAGNVLGQLERCKLSDAFSTLVDNPNWTIKTSTIGLVDFGNAASEMTGFWPNSDLGNPERTFRYAVTNLRLVDGHCSVVATDRDGQINVSDTVSKITVQFDIWDGRSNRVRSTRTFKR